MNKVAEQLNHDKSWINDDLINEVKNNPILSKGDTQSPEFMKEMMKVLGDHFTEVFKI